MLLMHCAVRTICITCITQMCCVWVVCVSGTLTQKDVFVRDCCFEAAPISWADRELGDDVDNDGRHHQKKNMRPLRLDSKALSRSQVVLFPQQQNFAMGFLAQISSGAIRCSFNARFRTRFRRVLVQIPREVPEGSGADASWGSGGLRCRCLGRFRRVLVQMLCEIPKGSDVF